jgi:hypothetical protein
MPTNGHLRPSCAACWIRRGSSESDQAGASHVQAMRHLVATKTICLTGSAGGCPIR